MLLLASVPGLPRYARRGREHFEIGGTTTSRERLINIFMSAFVYIFTFIRKTSSKSVLTDCSELYSEIILSECRIVGALEGTRLELGMRLVTLQPYTLILVQYSSSELQELQVLVC